MTDRLCVIGAGGSGLGTMEVLQRQRPPVRLLRAVRPCGRALAHGLRVAAPDHLARPLGVRRLSDAGELPDLPEPRPDARVPRGVCGRDGCARARDLRGARRTARAARGVGPRRLAGVHVRRGGARLRGSDRLQRPSVEPERPLVFRDVHGQADPFRGVRVGRRHRRNARAHGRRRELGLRPRRRCRGRVARVDDLHAARADVPAEVGVRAPARRAHMAHTAPDPGQRAHLAGAVRRRDRAGTRVPRARRASVAEPQRAAAGREQPPAVLDPARADPRRSRDRAARRPERALRRRDERGVRHDPVGNRVQADPAFPGRRRHPLAGRCAAADGRTNAAGRRGEPVLRRARRTAWAAVARLLAAGRARRAHARGSTPGRARRWLRASPSSRRRTRASTSSARSGSARCVRRTASSTAPRRRRGRLDERRDRDRRRERNGPRLRRAVRRRGLGRGRPRPRADRARRRARADPSTSPTPAPWRPPSSGSWRSSALPRRS